MCPIRLGFIVTLFALIPVASLAQPVQSFGDLGSRLKVGSRVRVEDRTGTRVTGPVTRLTAEEITIKTGDGERRFGSDSVTGVELRRGRGWLGAAIGFGGGAAIALALECRAGEHNHCGDGIDILGPLGAAAGAITGAMIPRFTPVYHGEKKTSLAPVLSPGHAGVVVSLRW